MDGDHVTFMETAEMNKDFPSDNEEDEVSINNNATVFNHSAKDQFSEDEAGSSEPSSQQHENSQTQHSGRSRSSSEGEVSDSESETDTRQESESSDGEEPEVEREDPSDESPPLRKKVQQSREEHEERIVDKAVSKLQAILTQGGLLPADQNRRNSSHDDRDCSQSTGPPSRSPAPGKRCASVSSPSEETIYQPAMEQASVNQGEVEINKLSRHKSSLSEFDKAADADTSDNTVEINYLAE